MNLLFPYLKQFNDLSRRFKRKVKVIVSDKPEETIVPVEPTFEAIETVFPVAGQPSADFFEDNEFQVTDKFKSSLPRRFDK